MRKGSILVVDDEIEIREGLEALLTSESFDVTLAESGAAGLQKLDDRPFDLMLLDVSLPDRMAWTCSGKSGCATRIFRSS